MLTQWPGGYLGDRYGHRTVIAVSLVWAGIATPLSGVITGLAFGITIATVFAPTMIDLGKSAACRTAAPRCTWVPTPPAAWRPSWPSTSSATPPACRTSGSRSSRSRSRS
jgi:MFS family permease